MQKKSKLIKIYEKSRKTKKKAEKRVSQTKFDLIEHLTYM